MSQEDQSDRINQLLLRLEALSRQQEQFSREIRLLREELYQLRKPVEPPLSRPMPPSGFTLMPDPADTNPSSFPVQQPKPATISKPAPVKQQPDGKNALERLIGENIINKIGIIITVIGVAIGTKYSIDHNLISPVMRIVLGYAAGTALLLVGIRLKEKYHAYSAVLVSGSMAVMYFVTYAAFSFYHLLPQLVSFMLMLVLTVGTVYAAIRFNATVIAHIGLVGAYAIPFLLGDHSGRTWILFSYMAIINAGILAVAVLRYWKSLYYAAFLLSWVIFGSWYFLGDSAGHQQLAWSFLLLFFIEFYSVFLVYKLLRNEKFALPDIALLLSNAFIFYGLGYTLLQRGMADNKAGLFTAANAAIHALVGFLIYTRKLADRSLFYLAGGLALLFITIAVPVQLNGNWVTLLWIGEACLLFWIGRNRNDLVYEYLSVPLFLLSLLSLMDDWWKDAVSGLHPMPLFNISFLSNLLFVAACAGMVWTAHRYQIKDKTRQHSNVFAAWVAPVVLVVVLYVSFSTEIVRYWNNQAAHLHGQPGAVPGSFNFFETLTSVWLIIYTMLFAAALTAANEYWIKNRKLAMAVISITALVVFLFLSKGLLLLSNLRDEYSSAGLPDAIRLSTGSVAGIRYMSLAVAGLLVWILRRLQRTYLPMDPFSTILDLFVAIALLWVLSSELVNWLVLAGSKSQYKLGLSILWGVYALALVVFGIWKNKQHLRVLAFVVFGLTLVKLFFYDIAELETIPKTIVFVSLGVLLLIISFLYNKYRQQIAGNDQKDPVQPD